jgi:hypothetical protein
MNRTTLREIVALGFVGLALCIMLYNQVKVIAPIAPHSMQTFAGYALRIDFPAFETEIGYVDLQKSWKPRILSNILGSAFVRSAINDDGTFAWEKFPHLAALYASLWLGLIFLLYLVFVGRAALIPILGTYAAVAFGYMPGIGDRIFPWEMPALFFFTLFICLMIKGKLEYFLFVLPVAVLFKETAAVLAVAYLFLGGTARRRLLLFSLALLLSGAAKLSADWLTHSAGRFTFDTHLLLANLRYTVLGKFPYKEWYASVDRIDHPLFLNAGFLVAFFIYPFRSKYTWMLRTIVILFTLGSLFWGVVFEYRIWFELIPILLYPFYHRQLAGKGWGDTPKLARQDGAASASKPFASS